MIQSYIFCKLIEKISLKVLASHFHGEAMVELSDSSLFWLNVTNIVLGIVTLVCCVAVGYEVIREIQARLRKRRSSSAPVNDHPLPLSKLGITMADGGKRIMGESPGPGKGNEN